MYLTQVYNIRVKKLILMTLPDPKPILNFKRICLQVGGPMLLLAVSKAGYIPSMSTLYQQMNGERNMAAQYGCLNMAAKISVFYVAAQFKI